MAKKKPCGKADLATSCYVSLCFDSIRLKSLKCPTIQLLLLPYNYNFVSFSTSITQSGSFNKLMHNMSSTSQFYHFYFNHVVRLWNSLTYIDLHIYSVRDYFWNHFLQHFNSNNFSLSLSTYVTCVHTLHMVHFSSFCNLAHCRAWRLLLATTFCFFLYIIAQYK